MCRSITALRGLEPPATHEEVRDAARQFVGKVASLSTAQRERTEVRRAVEEIARVLEDLIEELPARRSAPKTVPPRRRLGNQDAAEATGGQP